jgi:hypothetical protein
MFITSVRGSCNWRLIAWRRRGVIAWLGFTDIQLIRPFRTFYSRYKNFSCGE